MGNFILGILFGIIISTVGLTGVAKMIDKSVTHTKTIIEETAK
jgi:hypothetical protein